MRVAQKETTNRRESLCIKNCKVGHIYRTCVQTRDMRVLDPNFKDRVLGAHVKDVVLGA